MKVTVEYDTVTKQMKAKKGDEDIMDELECSFYPSGEKGKYTMDMRARKYDEENKCVHMYTMYANEKGELVKVEEDTVSAAFVPHMISAELIDKFHKVLRGC